MKGQVDSLILASAAKEKRTYDDDGRLISKNRVSTVGSVGTLVSDFLGYDAMNHVISVTEQVQQQQPEQTLISYDGLGAVLAKETGNGLGARVEEFRNDAFGNVVHRLTRRTAGLINDAPFAMTYNPTGESSSAFANPNDPSIQNQRKDQLLQQSASGGQLIRQQQRIENRNTNTVEFQSAARHYYGADDRLMAVEHYSYRSLSVLDGTWEDYWYDALGRRVLTHARREQGDNPPVSYAWKLCTGSIQCRSFTERVWWDGDNSLVEERTPEGASSDVSNSGLIGNIHGLSLDEPLAVITLGENTRIINYNWRGQGMSSVFTDGSAGDISLGNTSTEVDWPASTQAETYFARSPDATESNNAKRWLGTFVANGQGTTGMLYRRNRYFDPKSGQFTQADPIGIAGGMNAFGFAAGDPVNFSDPFGLCGNPTAGGFGSLACVWRDFRVGAEQAASRTGSAIENWLEAGAAKAMSCFNDPICVGSMTVGGLAEAGGEAASSRLVTSAAQALSKRLGTNRVEIPIEGGFKAVDLVGRPHAGVPTPHVQVYRLHTDPLSGASRYKKEFLGAAVRQDIVDAARAAGILK